MAQHFISRQVRVLGKLELPVNLKPHGRFATRRLFREITSTGLYWLEDWRRLFMEVGDPTEYAYVQKLGISWHDWQRFKDTWPYFASVILPEWQDELAVKLRSIGLATMLAQAKVGDGTAAARWVAEGKWQSQEELDVVLKGVKGRKKGKPKEKQPTLKDVEKDYDRLQQHLSNRGAKPVAVGDASTGS